MATFSAKLLENLIHLRLMDQQTIEKCLKVGLASLESVIKSAVENLNNLLDSDIERIALSNLYSYAFIYAQDQSPEISYGKSLSGDNINKYVALYVSQIVELVEDRLALSPDSIPSLETEINFKAIEEYIQKRLSDPETKQRVFEKGRSSLESLLKQGVEDYYPHLNGDNECHYLSDRRYHAIYFARLNCPDIESDQPLSKESCSRFINEFMDALINFTYTSSLKNRLD